MTISRPVILFCLLILSPAWPDCFSAMPIPVSASSDGTREANQFSTEKSA